MTTPPSKIPKGKPADKGKSSSASDAKSVDPALYEAVLKERRRQVRPIPVPDVSESNTDSDWAKFSEDEE